MSTISDRKVPVDDASNIITYFLPDVDTYQDYFPFGMVMSERSGSEMSAGYRYGFGGQEQDNELYGQGNSYTAEFWQYDTRLGRRWNPDPITYPWQSTYATFNNNPIIYNDPLGLFGSRKEARQYKKDNDIKGRIHKGDDGVFSIDNKKENTSLFRDPSVNHIENVVGRQEDGVIKSALVTPESEASLPVGAFVDGFEDLKNDRFTNKQSWKYSHKTKKALETVGVNIQTRVVNQGYKRATKTIAKRVPIIGYVIDGVEIYQGYQQDGNMIGVTTATEVSGAVGGIGGAVGGAYFGAAIGSMIFPGVGTVVGGVIGAALGSWGGETLTESATGAILEEY